MSPMLLTLLRTGRWNPPFSWTTYRPGRIPWSELLDLTTISLTGAFLTALALVLAPGDQTRQLLSAGLALFE